MVPEHIIKFISTPIGKAVFAELSKGESAAVISMRKKSFLDPPKNVRRWLETLKKLEDVENKLKNS